MKLYHDETSVLTWLILISQEELEELCSQNSTEGLLQAMKGESEAPKSIIKCLDIYPALKLADREKPVADVSPSQPIPTKVARGFFLLNCQVYHGIKLRTMV